MSQRQHHDGTHRTVRVIAHVDMDAFFVSVERILDPGLEHQPVIVAHDSPRSVVLSASYDVRSLGVHSAQPVAQAKQLAPHALMVEPTRGAYQRASERIMEIFRELTPWVEQVSVDEAFLDITGVMRHYGAPKAFAQHLRSLVLEATGLPASVGLGPNKFLAKMASEKAKPNGIFAIPPHAVRGFMEQLPVRELFGVGKATEHKLRTLGFLTAGDLASADPRRLQRILGQHGLGLIQLAQGIDPRPVVTEREEKSISHEHTFNQDIIEDAKLVEWIKKLSHQVAERARAGGHRAYVVGLKLRWDDFTTLSRQRRVEQPTDAGTVVAQTALELFRALARPLPPVRLIGVRVAEFASAGVGEQLMFNWEEHDCAERAGGQEPRRSRLSADQTMDAINARFKGVLRPASLMVSPEDEAQRPDYETPGH